MLLSSYISLKLRAFHTHSASHAPTTFSHASSSLVGALGAAEMSILREGVTSGASSVPRTSTPQIVEMSDTQSEMNSPEPVKTEGGRNSDTMAATLKEYAKVRVALGCG